MTSKEIKNKRKQIENNIKLLHGEIEFQKALLKNLQSQCEHPKAQLLCSMGDNELVCPDCGMGS
jgi:hypothetical protein